MITQPKTQMEDTPPCWLRLVEQYCSDLGLPFDVSKWAQSVAPQASRCLEGRHPQSIAAAVTVCAAEALHLSCSVKDVVVVSQIAPQTLKKCLSVLRSCLVAQDTPVIDVTPLIKQGSPALCSVASEWGGDRCAPVAPCQPHRDERTVWMQKHQQAKDALAKQQELEALQFAQHEARKRAHLEAQQVRVGCGFNLLSG